MSGGTRACTQDPGLKYILEHQKCRELRSGPRGDRGAGVQHRAAMSIVRERK